ncbi:GNAT family N-acetyltransferase [Nocardioides campestrisoli]|uniref:GNAT family N-acetyltransferase n=1 Tax=Nocardioides campestrisoli TaxID=2736757 RepID=UPI00163DD779|nr:GNAT family N-acetyltransferase [Nocardioides campestrisoli]
MPDIATPDLPLPDLSAAARSARSLGYRTDLALLERAGSTVEDRGTHLVVRTLDNPDFYWGNFLLLRELPLPGGAREVMAACWTEFPTSDHRAIAFDLTEPLTDHPVLLEFLEAGMTASTTVTLTTSSLTPPARPHQEAELRPLAGEDDWEQQVALTIAADAQTASAALETYARKRVAAERARVDQGLGQRWGAFLDGRLVSTAALFRVDAELARYQSVVTHPELQRQGLATTLVHRVGAYGLSELGVSTLVILAEEGAPAEGLYRGLGFEPVERVTELLALPRRGDHA